MWWSCTAVAPVLCVLLQRVVLCCAVLQIEALRRGVDVVVGTPGRVMDLLDRKKLNPSKVRPSKL